MRIPWPGMTTLPRYRGWLVMSPSVASKPTLPNVLAPMFEGVSVASWSSQPWRRLPYWKVTMSWAVPTGLGPIDMAPSLVALLPSVATASLPASGAPTVGPVSLPGWLPSVAGPASVVSADPPSPRAPDLPESAGPASGLVLLPPLHAAASTTRSAGEAQTPERSRWEGAVLSVMRPRERRGCIVALREQRTV